MKTLPWAFQDLVRLWFGQVRSVLKGIHIRIQENGHFDTGKNLKSKAASIDWHPPITMTMYGMQTINSKTVSGLTTVTVIFKRIGLI